MRRAAKVVVFAVSCLSLIAFLTGCPSKSSSNPTGPTTNYPPEISTSSPDLTFDVALLGTQALSVTATDPDGDALTYTWHADAGTVTPLTSNSSQATFTAPATPALVPITVTVSDGKGHAVVKGWQASVGIIHVQGNISTLTTWQTGNIYIIDDWVSVVSTLEIQPGVIVKLGSGGELTTTSSGTITANGTSLLPITFTSIKDDAHGGDNNGDGTASSPVAGDWDYVDISGGNGSIFMNCNFYYATTALMFDNSQGTVDTCVFAHNTTGLDLTNATAGTVAKANIMFDNVYPMYLNTDLNIDASNSFHNPLNSAQKNVRQGIVVGYGTIGGNITWNSPEVAIVSDGFVVDYATLTITPGTIIKFTATSDVSIRTTGTIVGMSGAGTVFTSYKDDTYGGDSNGDGNATTPSSGDWTGIWSDAADSYIDGANILYAAN